MLKHVMVFEHTVGGGIQCTSSCCVQHEVRFQCCNKACNGQLGSGSSWFVFLSPSLSLLRGVFHHCLNRETFLQACLEQRGDSPRTGRSCGFTPRLFLGGGGAVLLLKCTLYALKTTTKPGQWGWFWTLVADRQLTFPAVSWEHTSLFFLCVDT